jgi:predicted phage-related endonuclease
MNPQLVKTLTKTQKEIAAVEAQVLEATADLQKKLLTLREKDNEVRTAIKEAMIKNNVKKFDSDNLTITLIAASTRKTLDTAAIKEQEPEVYEKYLKETPVAASVRIKVK